MARGQTPITIIFYILVFVLLFAFVLSGWLKYWGEQAVTVNNLTGVEAFVFSNLNVLVFVCLCIVALAAGAMLFGGGGGY